MREVTDSPTTESRKADHIRINLEKNVDFPRLTTGLEQYRFMHRALPEINLADIDTHVTLFGKTRSASTPSTSTTIFFTRPAMSDIFPSNGMICFD